MSIMEKAEELAKEIIDTAEYKELKSAETNMHNNEEAKSLLEDYQAKQKQLQMMQANGKNVNQQQQKKIQTIQNKLQKNPKIRKFMEAQQKFNKLMETINQTISEQLQNA